MATFPELQSRLSARFSGVPGVTPSDLSVWLTEAVYQYGYSPFTVTNIPDDETYLLILLAQIQGARAIALSTAHYFKYTDAEETVDKTAVSKQYRDLASDLSTEYRRELASVKRKSASSFRISRRLDRDVNV